MEVIRKKLERAELIPDDIRYDVATETVQTYDGTQWVDTPERDPRNVDAFPPPDSADPRCDGAARMAALLQEMEQNISDGLQASAAAAELATVILLVLAFIPLINVISAVIVGTMAQFVVVGYAGWNTAFSALDWDLLKCLIYCDLQEDGFIRDNGLTKLRADINANFAGANADIYLNAILDMVGRGGLNDAAAVRTETGDCSGCTACSWVVNMYPDSPGFDWYWLDYAFRNCAGTNLGGAPHGSIVANAWRSLPRGAQNLPSLQFGGRIHIPAGSTLTKVLFHFTMIAGSNLDGTFKQTNANGVQSCFNGAFSTGWNWVNVSFTDIDVLFDTRLITGNGTNFVYQIDYVEFTGTGINPFL